MKRIAILSLLVAVVGVVGFAAYRFLSESYYESRLEELGVALDAEIAAFLQETWPRTPLPGEPVEGYAFDWYRRAGREGMTSVEALDPAIAWNARSVAEAACDAWIEDGKPIPAWVLEGEPARFMAAWLAPLALAEKGTRCSEVGPRTTVTAPITDGGDPIVGDVLEMAHAMDLAVAADVVAGRPEGALRRVLVYLQMGDDLARGGLLLESMFGRFTHERGGLILERLLGSGGLDEAGLAAAADALCAGLRDRIPAHLEGRAEGVWTQRLFRDLGTGEASYDDLTGRVPSDMFERAALWFEGGVSRREAFAAWRTFLEIRDRLETAAEAGPEAFRAEVAADQGWADSRATRWFAPHGALIMPPTTLLSERRGNRLRDEARILACLALLRRHRTGTLPASVEEIRPSEVRPAPDGCEWRLAPAGEGQPASLQLVREGAVVREIGLE